MRTDIARKGFDAHRAQLEREKEKPGFEGVHARALLAMMPGLQTFFEGEARRQTSAYEIKVAVATIIANELLATAQLLGKKRERPGIANEIMSAAHRICDRKLSQTAGGILLPH